MTADYRWTFYRSGGVDQVALQSGEDIAHLSELDPKLWLALSMPTRGVEIDPRTLDLLDTDKDGHIRHPEVLAAIAWTAEVYRDVGKLLDGGDTIALETLKDGPVLAAAKRLLVNLGKPEAGKVSLADATSAEEMFAGTRFNGDGVIAPECAPESSELRAVIADIMKTHGTLTDRTGVLGIDKPRVDAFFLEARALIAWLDQSTGDAAILPLGEATMAAADAVRAIRAKVDDYFTRCRLAAFDTRAAAALNPSDTQLTALATRELSAATADVASLPLARIEAGAPLPLIATINPAWEAQLATLVSAAITPLLGGARASLSEADWRAVTDKLSAHETWRAAKPANTVESLGFERLRAIIAPDAGHEAAIHSLIEQDLALKPELDRIVDVEKLCRFQRDLIKLLHNYVNFSDFYARKGAVFQAGTLYLDGRGCNLVVEVSDAAKHGTMAPMAGAYLAYCDCVRAGDTADTKTKKTIAAAFTAGEVDNLMVGRNGVFVDRQGRDWEATITKIIDNPISIRQAFWAPYKKLVRMIEERVAKRASAADAEVTGKLDEHAGTISGIGAAPPADAKAAKPPAPGKVDVGTVAALGVAIGGIGAFATAILAAIFGLGWWMPLGIFGIMLAISTPSMVLAFIKLRRRNLGPLLDANGWAINSLTRINLPFGTALTEIAALPPGARRASRDPYADRQPPWRLYAVLAAIISIALAWYLGKLDRYLPVALRSTSVLGESAPAAAAAKVPDPGAPAAGSGAAAAGSGTPAPTAPARPAETPAAPAPAPPKP